MFVVSVADSFWYTTTYNGTFNLVNVDQGSQTSGKITKLCSAGHKLKKIWLSGLSDLKAKLLEIQFQQKVKNFKNNEGRIRINWWAVWPTRHVLWLVSQSYSNISPQKARETCPVFRNGRKLFFFVIEMLISWARVNHNIVKNILFLHFQHKKLQLNFMSFVLQYCSMYIGDVSSPI